MAAGLRLAADAGLASTDVLNASTLPALEAWLARDRSLPDTT
jgi:hypothetical protein